MSSDRVIVQALTLAHNLVLVCQNLPPAHLTDASIVLRLRELVYSPSVRLALERGSDTLPAFALREVACVLSDYSQIHGEIIVRTRDVLDEPHLNEALGLPQNRRTIDGGGNDGVRSTGFTPPAILFFGRNSEWSCAPPYPARVTSPGPSMPSGGSGRCRLRSVSAQSSQPLRRWLADTKKAPTESGLQGTPSEGNPARKTGRTSKVARFSRSRHRVLW
jgi:hypothetical protein